MNSKLMTEIMNVRIKQLNGGENKKFELETNKIIDDLLNVYYHFASIKPKLKYHWICSECIKCYGINCDHIIQKNKERNNEETCQTS